MQRMRRRSLLAGLALWPAFAGASGPAGWRLVPERSTIRFAYTLDGQVQEGRFGRFSGTGSFAPEAPQAARFTLRIDTLSIDLGNALVDAYATSREWFDSKRHPEVVYRLDALTPRGTERYRALGTVRIKGRQAATRAPMRLEIGADEARATGSLTVSRRAFALGTELTDLVVDLADAVTVHFDLMAERRPRQD